ncbi:MULTISPECIES: glycosyltransferase family 8 protein [Geobacillus]|uniref:glycosyltransferase family 8 protein n=1 Tax=Geobacillus TaxID=129337 RepID=UPI000A63BE3C|nr:MULTISPECIES: glycosyltransferase family 8 protein [Geobacillus]MED4876175.1 glycosyltransferase family 8 protein [Anoxybacillus geothermalis]MED4924772.1 glycosyltransferase family 8 protein [Anoxybacillus geothermalis]
MIVSATNDHYAQHLAVMLTSLLKNQKMNRPIHIYILYSDLSTISMAKLQRVVGQFHTPITFLRVDVQLFADFASGSGGQKYISKEAYYRMIIPDVLGEEISKALYLDCDIIVRTDLTELWETNIEEYDLAAVDESRVLTKSDRDIRMNRLSLPPDSYYFNSGVLLMNLKRWREKNISAELMEFVKSHGDKLALMDQDALNAVLFNRWLRLDDKWNFTAAHSAKRSSKKAAILHFTGPEKPWNSKSPFAKEYRKYLKKSLWEKPLSLE